MSSGGKRGAGERVLESRHVIGLFLAVILLSGLFFTLGYVMGRNQAEGQVSAADLPDKIEPRVLPKTDAASKRANKTTPAQTPADTGAPASSDWEFYHAGDAAKAEDRLKPAAPPHATPSKNEPSVVRTVATPRGASNASRNSSTAGIPGGGYTLQVAAMTREADALDLAKQLQKKKFPAFVLSPHGDKYYRVQVGPYADPKAADAARKGLEGAGFKAIVKH
jgi:cell division septation protein DedD